MSLFAGAGYVTPTLSLPLISGLKREPEPAPGDDLPGVYILFNGNEPVYIGQSGNVARRFSEHRKEGKKEFDSFAYLPLDDLSERLRLEGILALANLPANNATLCLRLAKGKVYQLHYRGLRRPKPN